MLFNYGEYATFKRRNMSTNKEIIVLNETVRVQQTLQDDYISLTDIAKYKNPDDPRFIIQNWMRTRFTVEFLGIWEHLTLQRHL